MYRKEYLNLDAITKSNSLTVQRGSGYSFQASEQNYAKDYLCVRIFSKHSLEQWRFASGHPDRDCHYLKQKSISLILTPSDASLIGGGSTRVVTLFLQRLIFVKYCLQTLHFPPVAIFMAHFLQDSKHLQGTGQYSVRTASQTKHNLSTAGLSLALLVFNADKLVNIFFVNES